MRLPWHFPKLRFNTGFYFVKCNQSGFKGLYNRFPAMPIKIFSAAWFFDCPDFFLTYVYGNKMSLKKKKREETTKFIFFLTGLASELICLLVENIISTARNLACQSRQHDSFMYRCKYTGFHFWQNERALWGRYEAFFISLMINKSVLWWTNELLW